MRKHTARISTVVAALAVVVVLTAVVSVAQPKGATVTIKGEAVDLWCYMEGGDRGPAKKECATACAKVSVLLVPADLFFYRTHPGQELVDPRADQQYATASGHAWRMLKSPECPLSAESLERAKRNFAFVQARGAFRHLKRFRLASAMSIVRHAGPDAVEWIRYGRPPRRSATAGTPPALRELQA